MAVRRERVVLELEDRFTGPIVRAAAATELLNKRLDSLSGEAVRSSKSTRDIEKNTDSLGKTAGRTEKDIDKLSGRLRIMADLAAVLGPSLVPIGAIGIPAISGLTSVLGFLTTGIGASAFAFQGLGDAMKAVEKAQVEPTKENLDALRVTLAGLTPATQAFVSELRSFMPILDELQGTSAAGLFPGLTEGLEGAKKALPQIETVIQAITTKVGEIGADVGKSLGDGDWNQFFDFIGTEGPAALGKMAEAAGNLTHGLAGLWMSTTPLNNDFLDWLIKATDRFDEWSNDLGQSEGFHEFIDYVRKVGPEVGDAIGSLANALIQVTQAVAPLGGPSLKIIEALADAISTIADSPIGTPLLGLVSTMGALKLATRGYQTFQDKTFGNPAVSKVRAYGTALTTVTSAQQRAQMSATQLAAVEKKRDGVVKEGNASLLRGATTLGAFAFQASGAADKLHLTNTASLALAGSFAGPWGAGIGAAVGGIVDLTSSLNKSIEATDLQKQKWQDYIQVVTAKAGSDPKAQLAALQPLIDTYQKVSDIGGLAGQYGSQLLGPLQMAAEQIKQNIAINDAMASSQGNAAEAMAEMSRQAQSQVTALNAARTASQSANEAFLNYGDTIGDTKKTLDQFIADVSLKAKALAEFGNNTTTALDRGLNAKVIEWLRSQGPEGALRLQQLAHGAQADIVDLNKAWGQFAVAGRKNVAAGVAVEKQVERTKQAVKDATAKRYMFQLDANTAPAIAAVDRLVRQIRGYHINIPVTASTNANLGEAAALTKGHASGGYTGSGGKYEPAGIVHRGEFVFSSEATSGNEAMLDAFHRHLRGYDDGGFVGQLLNSSGSSSSSSSASSSSATKPKKSKKKLKASDVLTRQEYRDALSSLIDGLNSTLGLGPSGPGAEVRAAFKSFADQIRQDGGKVGSRFHVLEEQLVRTAVALDRQKTKLDGLNTSLDDLKQSASSLASSVASGFTTDIFAQGYDPFAASDQAARDAGQTPATHSQAAILGAGIQQVLQDAQDAGRFAQDISQLKDRGFGGSGLEALANSNNLGMADALLGLSPQALQAANTAFAQRSQALNSAGSVVSSAVFGDAMAKLTAEVSSAKAEIAALTKVEKDGVSAIKALPPAIGKATTASLNGVAHAASMEAGR